MIALEDWQTIRERRIGNAEPIKGVSRETGFAIDTIRKYTRSSSPPRRHGNPTRTPQMGFYESDVDALLKQEPKISAVRIANLLHEKYPAFSLRERGVRSYVARRRRLLCPKEVFIRQVYRPGDQMQYDFQDVQVIIAGEVTDLHMFDARLSYSTAWFAHCYRTEDRPAVFDGLLRATMEFGGVTREGVFDNPKTAVDKVLRGRRRNVNSEFAVFVGGLGLHMEFAAPAKGNEKGGVEGGHGYVDDNFLRPMPSYPSVEALNEELLRFSREDRHKRSVDGQTVADRLEIERAALRSLPAILPRPCASEAARVTKFAEVRYKTNRYSVPSQYVGRMAVIEAFATHIRVIVDGELVAEHPRLFGRSGASLDPLHYLNALKYKHRAVARAEVFNNERFPQPLRALLQRLIERDRDTAGKQFMRVIELLQDHAPSELIAAVEQAAENGVDDPAAIALLLHQRPSSVPAQLAMDGLPTDAQIAPPQVRLDGYVLAELKEVA